MFAWFFPTASKSMIWTECKLDIVGKTIGHHGPNIAHIPTLRFRFQPKLDPPRLLTFSFTRGSHVMFVKELFRFICVWTLV